MSTSVLLKRSETFQISATKKFSENSTASHLYCDEALLQEHNSCPSEAHSQSAVNLSVQRSGLLKVWRRVRAHLSDGHGAEDVEEDEGAVGVILAKQVTVRQPLDVRQRHEGQLRHDPAIEAENRRTAVSGLHPHFSTITYLDLISSKLGIDSW